MKCFECGEVLEPGEALEWNASRLCPACCESWWRAYVVALESLFARWRAEFRRRRKEEV